MNWIQTLAVLRAAKHDEMHIDSCLNKLWQISTNRKKFYKDKFETDQLGFAYWQNWTFEFENDLHNKIHQALRTGNGLIIGSCFSGYYLPALSLLKEHNAECMIMQGKSKQGRISDYLLEDFYKNTGVRLKIASVNTESSFALTKHLKRNGIAFVMLDMPLQGMTYGIYDFFGYPAIVGDGLYKIATKTKSSVLPVYTPRTENGLKIIAGDLQSADDHEHLISQTLKSLEKLIWTSPSDWWLWDYLFERWSAAKQQKLIVG